VSKRRWFERIRRWLKRLFGLQPKTRPSILKRWYGKNCATTWLERDTPGSLATYRITPRKGDCEYLITLDWLPDIRKLDRTLQHRRPFFYKSDVLLYRFGVFQVFPQGSSKPIGIWDVDLHSGGITYSLQALAPKRAVAALALHLLAIPHNPPHTIWSEQMERMNWLGLLEIKARAELKNPRHALKAYEVFTMPKGESS
jgi:hypothetical protein